MGSTPPFCHAADQLGGLLHDGQVRAEVRVEHACQSPGGAGPRPACRSRSVPMGMPNSSPSAARTAGAGCTTTCLFGSASGGPDLLGGVLLAQGAGGAGRDALAAVDAGRSRPASWSKAGSMSGIEAAVTGPMTPTFCTLPQARDAAAAQDALVVVAHDAKATRSSTWYSFAGSGKAVAVVHAQILAQGLQLAVLAAHAGQALACRGWRAAAPGSSCGLRGWRGCWS